MYSFFVFIQTLSIFSSARRQACDVSRAFACCITSNHFLYLFSRSFFLFRFIFAPVAAFYVLWCFMLVVFIFFSPWKKWKTSSWIFWCEMRHHWIRQRRNRLENAFCNACSSEKVRTFWRSGDGSHIYPVCVMRYVRMELMLKPVEKKTPSNIGARHSLKWELCSPKSSN